MGRRLELFKLTLTRKTTHVDHELLFTVAENQLQKKKIVSILYLSKTFLCHY